MVLVYLPTKLAIFYGVNVGQYSSTMEHMGMGYQMDFWAGWYWYAM
jgi:hypothetical protein